MMKPFTGIILCLLLVVVGNADAEDKGPLDGSWVPVSLTVHGKDKKVDKDEVQVIAGNKLTIWIKGKKRATASLKFDDKTKPATLDLSYTAPIKTPTWHCIYKVEGDTLTICKPDGTGMVRPKEFKSPPGSDLSLEVYTRKK
jgi:uncharacterized protein (TIGR03067 family)